MVLSLPLMSSDPKSMESSVLRSPCIGPPILGFLSEAPNGPPIKMLWCLRPRCRNRISWSPSMPSQRSAPLPRGWPNHVKSGLLHAISLAAMVLKVAWDRGPLRVDDVARGFPGSTHGATSALKRRCVGGWKSWIL